MACRQAASAVQTKCDSAAGLAVCGFGLLALWIAYGRRAGLSEAAVIWNALEGEDRMRVWME